MDGVLITKDRSYRPCEVNGKKGLFHCWTDGSGIVEFNSGSVVKAKPEDIRFLDSDSLFKEYYY